MQKNIVKKGLAFVVILLFICISITTSTAFDNVKKSVMPISNGNILYVGGSGSDNYTKIQDAIDDANNGDTIFVYSGLYDESLTIPVTIMLKGEEPSSTIINGIWNKNVIEVTADNVKIIGFTLTSSDIELWLKGIYIGAKNTEIAYNIFEKLGYGVEEFTSFGGANHSIHDNIFRNNYWGIEFYDTTNDMIYNNTFDNIYSGIHLYFSDFNTIFNNSFFDDGLYIEDSYNNNVYNNTINGRPIVYLENEKNIVIEYAGQILLFKCEYITIKGCDFDDLFDAVHLCACKHCKIMNNTFINKSGCYLDYDFDTIFYGNLFNFICGIECWKCIKTVIRYNNFTNCICPLAFDAVSLFTKINHNNFIKNSRDLVYLYSYFCIINQNYWDKPRILPKIIHVGYDEYQSNRILIDWHPAKKPYNIP